MRLVHSGVRADPAVFRRYWPLILCVVAVVIASLAQYLSSTGSGFSLSFEIFIMPFLCGSACGIGISKAHRTSMLAVSPFTPRQRTVFSYITMVINAAVFYIIFIVLFIGITLLFSLVFWAAMGFAYGEWTPFPFVVEESMPRAFSAYAAAYEGLYCIFLTFTVHSIANISEDKKRNIFSIAVTAGVIIFNCIVANICRNAALDGGFKYFSSANLHTTIECLKYPWILIIIMVLLAAGAIAASVCLTIKKNKSSSV